MSKSSLISAACVVLAGASSTSAQIQLVEDVIPLGDVTFPFQGSTSALLNGVRDLDGLTVLETRISWTVDVVPESAYDLSQMTWSASLPGPEGRRTVEFDERSYAFDGTSATTSIVTDALNGTIVADLIIPDGKEGPGGELSVFGIQFNGQNPFPITDPPWGELTQLQFDVLLVPTPGVGACGAGALLLATRRRRR